jgi:hypothetical protein
MQTRMMIIFSIQVVPKALICDPGGGRRTNFGAKCDGVVDCDDESDENDCGKLWRTTAHIFYRLYSYSTNNTHFISENEAVLFYIVRELILPQQGEHLAPYFCHMMSTSTQCRPFHGFKRFNLTGVYLKDGHTFSNTLLDEDLWDQPDNSWRSWRNIPFWKHIRLVSNGPALDLFYTAETKGMFPDRSLQPISLYRKRILRDGSVQDGDSKGRSLVTCNLLASLAEYLFAASSPI